MPLVIIAAFSRIEFCFAAIFKKNSIMQVHVNEIYLSYHNKLYYIVKKKSRLILSAEMFIYYAICHFTKNHSMIFFSLFFSAA